MEQPQYVQATEGREEDSHIFFNGDGYYYHVRERRASRVRLKCRHYTLGCHGTAAVNLHTGILRPLQPHTCRRDPLLPQDLALRREMVAHASQNIRDGSVRQILRRFRLRCENPALASRFTVARMHSALYEARSSNYPRIPKTLCHLGVLLGMPDMQAVCRTIDGQDFIFRGVCGAIHNKSVSIIFASGRMLHFLQSRRNLHIDGTFRKRPKKPRSIQILNIVTNFSDTVIAVMRVLMTRRTEVAYDALFVRLAELVPGLNPTRLHCDFERALMNALRTAFPDCPIAGCLWHYAVACSSQARTLEIAQIAAENEVVHTFVRCLCAAPLLPAELIAEGVEQIWMEVEASGWAQLLGPLFAYFRREWLPRIEQLSVYGFPERTNNLSESDNHTLSNVLPQNRPNIWRVISAFVEAEHLSWSDKLAVEDGRAVNGRRRWRVVANDAHVVRMTRLLIRDDITPGRFLHGVSYAILGPVNYGLRIQNNDQQDSDSDSSDNSDAD